MLPSLNFLKTMHVQVQYTMLQAFLTLFFFSKKNFGLSRLKLLSQFAHKFFIYRTRLLVGAKLLSSYQLILLPLFKSQPLIEPSSS